MTMNQTKPRSWLHRLLSLALCLLLAFGPVVGAFPPGHVHAACSHSGGTATCTTLAVCAVCGESYGETGGHSPAENTTYTDNGNGTHSFTCTVCGDAAEDHIFDINGTCSCGVNLFTVSDSTLTIDSTLGGKAKATERDVTILANKIRVCLDQGITSVIATGSEPAMIETSSKTNTAIGVAISYLMATSDNYGKIDLTLSDVTQIVDSEFWGAYTLNSITLPKVTTVGDLAFHECQYLKTITFGSVVTAIDPDAVVFYDVGEAVDGCDLVLNCGQLQQEGECSPNLETNAWCGNTAWKSITLTHTRTYSASGNILSEVCACGQVATATVTAADATYNGTEQKTATVSYSEGWMGGELTVSYENNIKAGTATAQITLGEVTASTTFTIAPKELTLKLTDCYKEYDGTANLTSFTPKVEGFIFYDEGSYKSDTLDYDDVYDEVGVDKGKLTVTLPDCKVGAYTTAKVSGITLTGEDAGNYTLAETLENVPISDNWGDPFEIGKASITISSADQIVAEGAGLDQTAYAVSDLPDGLTVSGVKLYVEEDNSTIYVDADSVVITNAVGEDVTANFDIHTYNSGVITHTHVGHTFDDNGFCATGECDNYQSAVAGTMTDEDGYESECYLIYNAGQLYWFAQQVNEYGYNSINGKLMADITVNADLTAENLREWTPIGSSYPTYNGHFDGNGKTISGLYVKSEGSYVGLFGGTDYGYQIKNIHITNSYFEGDSNVGALVGYAGSYISGCTVSDSVTVVGNSSVGGIVGSSAYGELTNCRSAATVTEDGEAGGGLVGYNYLTITNCYTTASKLVGYNNGDITNSYYLCDTETADGGKTAAQFASGEVAYLLGEPFGQTIGTEDYPALGGAKVYQIANTGCSVYGDYGYGNDENAVYAPAHSFPAGSNGFCECGGYQPAVQNGDTYEISNAGQLYWFASRVRNGSNAINGKLIDNITVNENVLAEMEKDTPDTSGFRTWQPIGSKGNVYGGTFDGNGMTISGLYFNDSSTDDVGLFGYNTGTIKNVGVVDSYFCGQNQVGGIVGRNFGGTVTDCHSSGTVSGVRYVGGVAGIIDDGYVTGCSNTGKVTGGEYTGGVVGSAALADITSSCNTGTVSGINYVGGVAGDNTTGRVISSCNAGAVSGSNYVGGVVGHASSLYAGLGAVAACYNIGTVSGSSYAGGVVGYRNGGTGTSCYYLNTCGAGGEGTAKTAAQFASGEVAYLLSQDYTLDDETFSCEIWGQNIDGEGDKDAYPVLNGPAVNYGYTGCTGPQYTNSAVTEAPVHSYDNGFCTSCDGYQQPETDAEGTYLIANAGNLYWFAAMINGEYGTDIQNLNANVRLTADIDLNPGYSFHFSPETGTVTIIQEPQVDPSASVIPALRIVGHIGTGAKGNSSGSVFASTASVRGATYADLQDTTPDNVDLSGLRTWQTIDYQTSSYANPVGGTFDGDGHTIRGMFCLDTNGWIGLMNNVGKPTTIRDLHIENSLLCTTGRGAGSLFALGIPEAVTGCSSSAIVIGSNDVGGLVGSMGEVDSSVSDATSNEGKAISGSAFTGTAIADYYVGGILGNAHKGTVVTNCWSSGSVIATKSVMNGSWAGGILGYAGNGRVVNSYFCGSVTGVSSNVGPIIGYGGQAYNNYYLGGSGDGSKTAAEFASGEVAYLLRQGCTVGEGESAVTYSGEIWGQTIGTEDYPALGGEKVYQIANTGCLALGDYSYSNDENAVYAPAHSFPAGSNGFCACGMAYEPAALVNGVYEISNAGQLYWFAAKVNAGESAINGKLTADIKINENVLAADGTLNEGEFRAWIPIGCSYNCEYTGTFDGGQHTISGLYYNDSEGAYVGLIGFMKGGTVKNVGVIDSYFSGRAYIGGVVGYCSSGSTIADCYHTGSLIGNYGQTGGYYVGGVVGFSSGDTITGCYHTGSIISFVNDVGGVVGFGSNATITDCYNTGSINSSRQNVGGVVGTNYGSTVTNCHNTGSVTGSGSDVGGVVGQNNFGGIIENCHNTASVTGGYYVGGVTGGNMTGSNATASYILNCYNTGSVTATGNLSSTGKGYYVGGVTGYSSGTVANCYNTGSVSFADTITGDGYYIGGVVGGNHSEGIIANCHYLTGCAKDGSSTVQNGIGNSSQGSTTEDTEGSTTAMTAEQFASGEVAYLLRQGCTVGEGESAVTYSGEIWGQNIDGEGDKDAYPVLNGPAVNYGYTDCTDPRYTNSAVEEFPDHNYADGVCSACGQTVSIAAAMAPEKDLNLTFTVSDVEGTDNYAMIVHTKADGTVVETKVAQADWNSGSFTYTGMAARNMADRITVTVYNSDGEAVSQVYTGSGRDCLMDMIAAEEENGRDSQKLTLWVDTLNYGAAAQTYFGYNTDDLANNQLSDAQKGYGTDTVTAQDQRDTTKANGGYAGATLALDNELRMNFVFNKSVVTTDMTAVFTYTSVDGTEKTVTVTGDKFTKYSNTRWRVTVTVPILEAAQLLTCTIYGADGTTVASQVSDSMEGYIARTTKSNALFTAILKYTRSASAYLNGTR